MHSQPQLSDLVVGSPGGRGLTPLGGQSRLKSEFEVLEGLGQGGFGDVLKVLRMMTVPILMQFMKLVSDWQCPGGKEIGISFSHAQDKHSLEENESSCVRL